MDFWLSGNSFQFNYLCSSQSKIFEVIGLVELTDWWLIVSVYSLGLFYRGQLDSDSDTALNQMVLLVAFVRVVLSERSL